MVCILHIWYLALDIVMIGSAHDNCLTTYRVCYEHLICCILLASSIAEHLEIELSRYQHVC